MEEDSLANIYYFVNENGDIPVKEFICSLPLKEQARIYAYIRQLKKEGNNLRRPIADYLRDGIYELRPQKNRVFYFFYLKKSAVLVHAIRKKSERIPEVDLKLCLKRKGWIEAEQGHIERLELGGAL